MLGKLIKTLIRNNALYTKFVRKYWLYLNYSREAKRFFSQNAKRVSAVSDMFADEKSRKTYLSMIKYRQTYKKKDYPNWDSSTPRYFVEELNLGSDEVYIDCGAYDGDTIDDFLNYCKGEYEQIIAFEPNAMNFETIKRKYGDNPKITLINAGVYDKDGEMRFSEIQCSTDSGIVENSNNSSFTIETKAIDNLGLEKVTFIKMDIEGAELSALKGAKVTILRDKPKLAICIYHSNDDMISIAEYIHDLIPEYKLYVKQHETYPIFFDTILYAVS